ncbi:MAG: hypothetical protein AUI33_07255 [Ignavibacteria bacterium 13_1_40CM_2_61_4]|nr:MAG: hypothetical protein AUI33_07255 [Ignavibacteria bacterium 13_1_40CM_2_61_4]
MMNKILGTIFVVLALNSLVMGGEDKTPPNTRQYYSGKLGFYRPSDGLNNGLLVGVDGITEFTHYNFVLSAAADLYLKQSIDIFKDPQPNGGPPPDVTAQQIILLPLHVNVGYKLLEISDADSRAYIGVGGGYYFYFYSVTYRSSGGLLGGPLSTSDTKNGGNVFASVFTRLMISQVFVEPRYYFATKSEDATGGYSLVVNPSGFAITLGFQYH